ncbi:hypothetical protein [Paenibacillus sp. 2TAB19]|uniref:hypothetical protein n=1 Tax=Paenibacillus sp. 2TAB19 TaxID=3233003 RepID=UPI003F9DCF07
MKPGKAKQVIGIILLLIGVGASVNYSFFMGNELNDILSGVAVYIAIMIIPGICLIIVGRKNYKSYIQSIQEAERHARENPIIVTPPPPHPPPSNANGSSRPNINSGSPKMIDCPSCGAKKELQPNQTGNCDYCGSTLAYR